MSRSTMPQTYEPEAAANFRWAHICELLEHAAHVMADRGEAAAQRAAEDSAWGARLEARLRAVQSQLELAVQQNGVGQAGLEQTRLDAITAAFSAADAAVAAKAAAQDARTAAAAVRSAWSGLTGTPLSSSPEASQTRH